MSHRITNEGMSFLTKEYLLTLSYRELQQLAKQKRIPCNIKKEYLQQAVYHSYHGNQDLLNAVLLQVRTERRLGPLKKDERFNLTKVQKFNPRRYVGSTLKAFKSIHHNRELTVRAHNQHVRLINQNARAVNPNVRSVIQNLRPVNQNARVINSNVRNISQNVRSSNQNVRIANESIRTFNRSTKTVNDNVRTVNRHDRTVKKVTSAGMYRRKSSTVTKQEKILCDRILRNKTYPIYSKLNDKKKARKKETELASSACPQYIVDTATIKQMLEVEDPISTQEVVPHNHNPDEPIDYSMKKDRNETENCPNRLKYQHSVITYRHYTQKECSSQQTDVQNTEMTLYTLYKNHKYEVNQIDKCETNNSRVEYVANSPTEDFNQERYQNMTNVEPIVKEMVNVPQTQIDLSEDFDKYRRMITNNTNIYNEHAYCVTDRIETYQEPQHSTYNNSTTSNDHSFDENNSSVAYNSYASNSYTKTDDYVPNDNQITLYSDEMPNNFYYLTNRKVENSQYYVYVNENVNRRCSTTDSAYTDYSVGDDEEINSMIAQIHTGFDARSNDVNNNNMYDLENNDECGAINYSNCINVDYNVENDNRAGVYTDNDIRSYTANSVKLNNRNEIYNESDKDYETDERNFSYHQRYPITGERIAVNDNKWIINTDRYSNEMDRLPSMPEAFPKYCKSTRTSQVPLYEYVYIENDKAPSQRGISSDQEIALNSPSVNSLSLHSDEEITNDREECNGTNELERLILGMHPVRAVSPVWEDVLGIISNEQGDTMNHVDSIQCVCCDWNGSSSLLEPHIRESHIDEIRTYIARVECSHSVSLGRLLATGRQSVLMQLGGKVLALLVVMQEQGWLVATVCLLSPHGDSPFIQSTITLRDAHNSPISWTGPVLKSNIILFSNPTAHLKVPVSTLSCFHDQVIWNDAGSVRPDLDDVMVEFHVELCC